MVQHDLCEGHSYSAFRVNRRYKRATHLRLTIREENSKAEGEEDELDELLRLMNNTSPLSIHILVFFF